MPIIRKHKSQEGFQKGHPKYSSIGDFKKGMIPWNKGFAVFVFQVCLTCGKNFEVRKSQIDRGRGKYCSRVCFAKAQKGKIRLSKRQRTIKKCQQCNKSFEIRPCEKNKKFCSHKCHSISRIGKKIEPFTEEHKRKIGEANKKITCSTRFTIGEDHPNWKGGTTPLANSLRSLEEYKDWRMACLKRDWFGCISCGNKESLEVHHIKSFSKILSEFLEKYGHFFIANNERKLLRAAIKYTPFWEHNNGITYCEKCHKSLRRKSA